MEKPELGNYKEWPNALVNIECVVLLTEVETSLGMFLLCKCGQINGGSSLEFGSLLWGRSSHFGVV